MCNEINQIEEHLKSENDDQIICRRAELLLQEARLQFDRFHSNIDALVAKITGLFQIYLVIIPLQLSIFSVLFSQKTINNTSFGLFALLIFFDAITILYFIYLLWPKKYQIVEIFEDKRFEKLCQSDLIELLQDFLFQVREAYKTNQNPYQILATGIKWTLILIIINFALFIALVLSLFAWN